MVSKGFAACPIYHAWKMLLGPWKAYTMLHSLTKKLSKFCRTKESTVIVLQVHNNISHYNSLLHCITFQLATKPIIVWNCLPLLSRAKMHSSHMNLENCIKNGNGKSWGTWNSDKNIKYIHSVWKSQKKSHSTLRAKRATNTFWVDKNQLKMFHFWELLKTLSLESNSVARLVIFNRT